MWSFEAIGLIFVLGTAYSALILGVIMPWWARQQSIDPSKRSLAGKTLYWLATERWPTVQDD